MLFLLTPMFMSNIHAALLRILLNTVIYPLMHGRWRKLVAVHCLPHESSVNDLLSLAMNAVCLVHWQLYCSLRKNRSRWINVERVRYLPSKRAIYPPFWRYKRTEWNTAGYYAAWNFEVVFGSCIYQLRIVPKTYVCKYYLMYMYVHVAADCAIRIRIVSVTYDRKATFLARTEHSPAVMQ